MFKSQFWQPDILLGIYIFNKISVCICSAISNSFVTPWTVAFQAPLSMEFSRQENWSGLPFPTPEYFPDPGIEPVSLGSLALVGKFFTTSTTWKAQTIFTISETLGCRGHYALLWEDVKRYFCTFSKICVLSFLCLSPVTASWVFCQSIFWCKKRILSKKLKQRGVVWPHVTDRLRGVPGFRLDPKAEPLWTLHYSFSSKLLSAHAPSLLLLC